MQIWSIIILLVCNGYILLTYISLSLGNYVSYMVGCYSSTHYLQQTTKYQLMYLCDRTATSIYQLKLLPMTHVYEHFHNVNNNLLYIHLTSLSCVFVLWTM